MLKRVAIPSVWIVLVTFVVLTATSLPAAAQTAGNASQTVTGCLQKGSESGGFFLTTGDNYHWELYSTGTVSLAEHAGQTVTVSGTSPHRTDAQEQVSQPVEKKEAGARKHGDLQVSSLKVVSASCSK
jgi:hypothetical protein